MLPKEEIIDQFEGVLPPDFSQVDEPHSALASLPPSIYITTNYDNFMVQALGWDACTGLEYQSLAALLEEPRRHPLRDRLE